MPLLALLAAPAAIPAAGPSAKPKAATATPKPGATTPATDNVATVGGVGISGTELDQRTTQALAEYQSHSNSDVPAELKPVVKRQILERLIQHQLLTLEAKRLGMTASDAEAEQVLQRDPFFNEGGAFNTAKYQAVKGGNSPQYRAALEQARSAATIRKLTDQALARAGVDDRAIRARASRGLQRASFDYLALRRSDFNEPGAEPRESEVLDFYRTHAAELKRPDRAELSLLWIQQALSDSTTASSQRLAAWEEAQHRRADSVLAAVRAGTRMEEIGKQFGGLKTHVVALPGNFPSYWRGDPRQSEAVFAATPGTILPSIVPSNPGWLVVRVDAVERAHPARLSEAAPEIRGILRRQRVATRDERELRALYEARRAELRGTAYRVRYAVIDTGPIAVGEPNAADLDHYYRGHLADYSTFNNQTGSVESQPFAAVKGSVRLRWIAERRLELARALAERIADTWSAGRRDEKLERSPGVVALREPGPAPLGAPVDSGAAAAAVTDSVAARQGALGVGVIRGGFGTVVFNLFVKVVNYDPTFEQARATLLGWRDAERARADAAGGQALYERDPRSLAIGKSMFWSSLLIPIPDYLTMKMTHREVEEYQRRHLDRYGAPELVHASHILVSPDDSSPEADARARARADSLLRALKAGENFARLARRFSDDEATRDQGGDLGEFGRGAMLAEFERAAFALGPGEMSGVVTSEAGYHIIRCHEHLPAAVQPLPLMYSNVSSDLALDKADSVSARRADSLFRAIRSPAQARRAAQKLGIDILPFTRPIGAETGGDPHLEAYVRKLETLKPGQLYPGVFYEKGSGYYVTWMDSVTAPVAPTWEEARSRAIERYQRGASQRALEAKRAELDSMSAQGWTLDSLAALRGGLEHATDVGIVANLPFLGPRDLDTLVFRTPGRLKIGEDSHWIVFPARQARLRVIERPDPNPGQLAARVESLRKLAEARALDDYFARLKQRFPVRILDAEMREVVLPPIPEDDSS